MDSPPAQSAPDTISAHLRTILRGILAVLGMWRLETSQIVLTHRRITAAFQRIERLLMRFRAGRMRRFSQRTQGPRKRERVAGRGPALPRKFGWLVQAGGYQAVGFGLQLQAVLNAPEMGDLLAASQQAKRILRPLCRALAVELPWTVDQPRVIKPRIRTPRPKPQPFRIPLPRGALSWARREGFGKLR